MGRFNLDGSTEKGVRMIREMINPKHVDFDKRIPATLIRHCEGVAFITIYKAGMFMLGGNLGTGCVIAKVPDANAPNGYRWSGPSQVRCGGLGGGIVFGGEQINSIILLNTKSAVRAFAGDKQVTFGGNLSLAAGPVGRDMEGHIGVANNKEIVAAYSYSQTKGIFFGATLEGAFCQAVNDENIRFYGDSTVTAERILMGEVRAPIAAQNLINELDMVINRTGDYAALESTMKPESKANVAQQGKSLLNRGLSSSEDATPLPPGWEKVTTPDGKPYYYNRTSNITQWERPMPPAAAVPPRPAAPAAPAAPAGNFKIAKFAYTAGRPDELTFQAGDRIEIVDQTDPNWWQAKLNGRQGAVPGNYF